MAQTYSPIPRNRRPYPRPGSSEHGSLQRGNPSKSPVGMNVDRLVLRKVLATMAVGGTTFLVSNAFKQPVIWSLSVAIFISGVALVVQFLVQFESHLKASTSVFQLIEASALSRDPAIWLVRLSTQLDPAASELLHDFARSEVIRVSEFMQGLVNGGDMIYDGEDRDWLLGLTRNVKSSIDATSLTTASPGGKGFVDEKLWTSDLGMRYLDAQRQAVRRGVRIRRIFILDRPELATKDDIVGLCKFQQRYGIEVRILSPADIPSIRRISLSDFVLFDDVVSYELTAASPFEAGMETAILNTRLELRHRRVQERIQEFKDLWESAHEIQA